MARCPTCGQKRHSFCVPSSDSARLELVQAIRRELADQQMVGISKSVIYLMQIEEERLRRDINQRTERS